MDERKIAEIAERIRARRLSLGLTFRDLEERTGIDKSSLQRYETTHTQVIPLSRIDRIADGLGVSPAYIMGWNTDDETARIAQKLLGRPDLKALLDVSHDVSPEDLQVIIKMMEGLKKK